MTRKAFVTGANGFVGRHLISQMVAQGWEIYALVRPGSETRQLRELGVHPVEAVMHELESVLQAMPPQCDGVFHLAGNTSMWHKQSEQQNRDNIGGTHCMVRAALEHNARRFVFTSSISSYGIHKGLIDERTIANPNPRINYSRSKYLAEQEVHKGVANGLDAVILNPCGILGAGDTHNWSQMIALIDQGKLPGVPPGGGNFCDVREVARAHLSAWEHGRKGENYILAGIEASFLELARTISHLLGKKAPRHTVPKLALKLAGRLYPVLSLISGEEPSVTPEKVQMLTHRVRADGTKAVEELGFDDQVPLEEMLQQCIDWMRANSMLKP